MGGDGREGRLEVLEEVGGWREFGEGGGREGGEVEGGLRGGFRGGGGGRRGFDRHSWLLDGGKGEFEWRKELFGCNG